MNFGGHSTQYTGKGSSWDVRARGPWSGKERSIPQVGTLAVCWSAEGAVWDRPAGAVIHVEHLFGLTLREMAAKVID